MKVGPSNTFFDIALSFHLKEQKMRVRELESLYVHRKDSKFHPAGEIIGQGMSPVAFRQDTRDSISTYQND